MARVNPEQGLFFANDNSKPFERKIIEDRSIPEVNLADVLANPSGAARSVVGGWARNFDRLLVHLDLTPSPDVHGSGSTNIHLFKLLAA